MLLCNVQGESNEMNRFWHFLKEQAARIRGSLERRKFESDFHEEVEAHLALLTELFIERGLSPEEARYAARKRLGGVTQMKNELRDRSRFGLLEAVIQDCGYVLRQLRKSPVFATAAILTLAIGIGANVAIFSLVDHLILRLLPVQDPQRVVALVGMGKFYGDSQGYSPSSYPMYEDIRDHNQVFSQTMCRRPRDFTVSISSESEVVSGESVSGNYFPLLGIRPAVGRLFSAADTLHAGANPFVVLSYAYWINHLGGDRSAIGRTIRVNNYPFTIIGVIRPGFDGLEPGLAAGIFVPITMVPVIEPESDAGQRFFDPRLRWVNVYGRLKAGTTIAQAKAGLQPLFHRILDSEAHQPDFRHATVYDKEQFLKMWLDVIPGGQGNRILRRQYEEPLWVLMGVAALVLLIACANIAGLSLARAAVRQKEIAVRLAIGAGRLRIAQQLITESLVLAIAGGAAGIGVALAIVKGLLAFLPPGVSGYDISSAPDLRILGFSMILTLITGVAFGLVPALQATRPDVAKTLKDQSASVTGGAGQYRFRKALVTAQMALSLLLLTGASLFIRSLENLRSLNPGFQTQDVLQFELNLGPVGYDVNHARAFFRTLEERLKNVPGVESTGAADMPVLSGGGWVAPMIVIAGYRPKPGEDMTAHVNAVSPGYFKTLGIHLLAGRAFRESDTATSQPVAVVNESFVKRFFGNEPAVGKFVGKGNDPSAPADTAIVGVVNDTDYENLRVAAPRQIFLCAAQHSLGLFVYVRTKRDPRSAFSGIRKLVHELDSRVPIQSMKTVERHVDESLATEHMIASLSSEFSLIATALAVIGLYGVMAYMVTQRAREMAIRIALGAVAGRVIWLVMRELVLLVAIGVAVALPLIFVLNRFVRSELYGIQANDVSSIVFAILVLTSVAFLAGYIPSRRAASSDPMRVLRYQ
jgi:predicted permease